VTSQSLELLIAIVILLWSHAPISRIPLRLTEQHTGQTDRDRCGENHRQA
jgi:hypothetical protein